MSCADEVFGKGRASKEGFSEAPTLLEEISQPAAFGNRALIIAADPNPILSGQRRSLAKVTSEIMLTGTDCCSPRPSGPTLSR